MPIKFPTMHIADSVVNRILNVSDELDAAVRPQPVMRTPQVPSTPMGVELQGAKIDEQTSMATGPGEPIAAGPDAGVAAVTPGSVIQGANLVDSIA